MRSHAYPVVAPHRRDPVRFSVVDAYLSYLSALGGLRDAADRGPGPVSDCAATDESLCYALDRIWATMSDEERRAADLVASTAASGRWSTPPSAAVDAAVVDSVSVVRHLDAASLAAHQTWCEGGPAAVAEMARGPADPLLATCEGCLRAAVYHGRQAEASLREILRSRGRRPIGASPAGASP